MDLQEQQAQEQEQEQQQQEEQQQEQEQEPGSIFDLCRILRPLISNFPVVGNRTFES